MVSFLKNTSFLNEIIGLALAYKLTQVREINLMAAKIK